MAPYGTLTIGRLTVTENWAVSSKSGSDTVTLSLSGEESAAVLGAAATARLRAENILDYEGTVVPAQFTEFSHWDGWYQVGGASVDEKTWHDFTSARWKCDLKQVGIDSGCEVESRLTGGNRTHASTATAELWHAPAVGADTYYVGASTPGFVSRVGSDGTVRVYRSIPAATHPRWAVPVASALDGAVSVTVGGDLRVGSRCTDSPTSWVLSNGLVRVEPRTTAGTLRVTSYLTSGWGTAKVFDLKRGTTSLGAAQHVTILRNDLCECILRLTWDHSPGRTTADLTLARGARHVGLYLQQYAAASALRVDDDGAGGTVSDQLTDSGYIERTDADGDGNGWVIGASVACTAAGTFGAAANAAALGLPAFIGCVRGGSSAQSGDTAAQVNAQWLGQPTQAERLVAR
jgi:hypothetical protein